MTPDTEGFFLKTIPNISSSERLQQTLVVDPHLARAAVLDRTQVAIEYYNATRGLGHVDPRYAAAYMETGYDPRRPPVSYVPVPTPVISPITLTSVACGETGGQAGIPGANGAAPGAQFNISQIGTARGFLVDVSAARSGQNAYITLGNFDDPATDLYIGVPDTSTSPFDTTVSNYTYIPPTVTYWPPFSTRTVVQEILAAMLPNWPDLLIPVIVYHRGNFTVSQCTIGLICA